MEIIYILAFIALVAVIFGVSMHQAFWGIVAFVVGAFIAAIATFYAKAKTEQLKERNAFYKTRQGQLVKQRKQELKKRAFMDDLSSALFLLLFFSPFLLATLMCTVFKEFSENNLLATMIICIAPVAIVLVSIIITHKKRTK